jgi:RND family efflux transporter MFP subunit
MDLSKLVAKAHIAQSEAALLKVGNEAQLHFSGVDEPMKGRVSLVSPALDPGSTTMEVWVEAKKPNAALKPGMTVQLTITGRSAKEALVVPAAAIFKNDEGAEYVAIAGADNHAQLKTVHIGIRNSDIVQITSGLKEGDRVITSGGYALPDKTPIKIEASTEKDAKEKTGAAPNDAGKDKE